MPLQHARFTIVLMVSAALVLACGQSTSPTSPTPIPLTASQIQSRYTAAATHYNQGEAQVAATENTSCDAVSAVVSLGGCQTALSLQRQLTIAYDNALRDIPFGATVATDVSHLLGDDAAIEKLLEQAATAASIGNIAILQQQVIPLLATAATDASALRSAIGLPAAA
jgi:hypothetical protein